MSATTKSIRFPIVTRKLIWFGVSIAVILSGFAKMAINKQSGQALNYGIDFTGGAAYVFKFEKPPAGDAATASAEIRKALAGVKANGKPLADPTIQVFGDGGVSVQTDTGSDPNKPVSTANAEAKAEGEAILQALRAKYNNVDLVGSELVGPVIGKHLRIMAIWALAWGCVLITAYIWFRYNIKGMVGAGYLFGLSAIISMIHDVLVMLAVYAWTWTEVNTNFVAAVLTVIGYSLNDTVIIFDRIRENMGKLDGAQRRSFAIVEQNIEDSLWQVMGRSVVTVVCTLLPLVTLFLFGGVTIHNFAFSLLVGVISGGYSSIFTAAPLFSALYRWRLGRDAASKGEQVVTQRARPAARERAEAPATPAAPAAPAAAAPSRLRERPTIEAPGDTSATEPGGDARRKPGAPTQSARRKRRH